MKEYSVLKYNVCSRYKITFHIKCLSTGVPRLVSTGVPRLVSTGVPRLVSLDWLVLFTALLVLSKLFFSDETVLGGLDITAC